MSAFFDKFFLVVAVLVAVLTVIDWSIGTEGRERTRQSVGDAWTTLQYQTLDGLAISALNPVRRLLNKAYGNGKGWKLVISAFLTNFIIISLAFLSTYETFPDENYSLSSIFSRYFRFIFSLEFTGLLSQSLLLTVMLLGWIPFKWLIDTLNSDIRPNAAFAEWTLSLGWLIVKIFGFSAFFVVSFFLLLIVWSYSITIAHAQIDISDIGGNPDGLAELLLLVVLTFAAIGLIAALPIVGAALIFTFLLLLRGFRPWLQPATLFLLDRLYQSKQGVLTQIAVGLGFVAKFIQEVLKYSHWLAGPSA